MCLAIPGKIIAIKGYVATIDYGSEKRQGRLFEKTYKKGDYVIVQGGIIVQKVEDKEAQEALKLYRQATT